MRHYKQGCEVGVAKNRGIRVESESDS